MPNFKKSSSKNSSSRNSNPRNSRLGRGLGSLLGENMSEKSFTSSFEEVDLPEIEFEELSNPAIKSGFVERPPMRGKSAIDLKATEAKVIKSKTLNKVGEATVKPVEFNKSLEKARVWSVDIERLVGNKNQPRKVFKEQDLKELSASIKEYGIIQPIIARKLSNGMFEIIAGERRWRASQQLGLHKVPVVFRETTDQKAVELALIENIQRSDLNPIEEALAYQHLVKNYGLTQIELSQKMGKERATVANIMRLLKLAPEVRKIVARGELPIGKSKLLLSIEDKALQYKVALRAVKKDLTVRALEKLIAKVKQNLGSSSDPMSDLDVSDRLINKLSDELKKIMGTKVKVDYKKGKGKIAIQFYSDDQLNAIVDKMRSAWS